MRFFFPQTKMQIFKYLIIQKSHGDTGWSILISLTVEEDVLMALSEAHVTHSSTIVQFMHCIPAVGAATING